MIGDGPTCQNPGCPQPIMITPGHRARRFCSDACRIAFHRSQQEEQQREKWRQLANALPVESRQALEEMMQTYDAHAAELAFDVLRHCFYDYGAMNNLRTFFSRHTCIARIG